MPEKNSPTQLTVIPLINRNRCEGKGDCETVCPYNVFSIDVLPKTERTNLNLKGKIKGMVHGWKQAMIVNPDQCHACGYCVNACPEQAITLSPRSLAK